MNSEYTADIADIRVFTQGGCIQMLFRGRRYLPHTAICVCILQQSDHPFVPYFIPWLIILPLRREEWGYTSSCNSHRTRNCAYLGYDQTTRLGLWYGSSSNNSYSYLMNASRTATHDSPTARQWNIRPQMESLRHPPSLGLWRPNNKNFLPHYPTVPLYPWRSQQYRQMRFLGP